MLGGGGGGDGGGACAGAGIAVAVDQRRDLVGRSHLALLLRLRLGLGLCFFRSRRNARMLGRIERDVDPESLALSGLAVSPLLLPTKAGSGGEGE